MKISLSILLLIVTTFNSFSVKCQNQKPQSSFVGEINPSIKLYGDNHILDFENGLIVTICKEFDPTTRKQETFICLIDLSFKQFGKISIKTKIKIPEIGRGDYTDANMFKIYRFAKSNIKVFQFKSWGIPPFYVIIDYSSKELYSVELKNDVLYKRQFLEQSNLFFFNNKGEFVVEFQKRTDNSLKLYQVVNNKGEIIEEYKKNKNLISPTCYYYRGLGNQNDYYEVNPDCAFNNNLHAYARLPILFDSMGKNLSEKIRENENTTFIQFYKGYYRDSKRDNSFVYTHNFVFDKGRVRSALISLDLKYLLINNAFIYSLPEIEITQ